jgi:hypothetical protein
MAAEAGAEDLLAKGHSAREGSTQEGCPGTEVLDWGTWEVVLVDGRMCFDEDL